MLGAFFYATPISHAQSTDAVDSAAGSSAESGAKPGSLANAAGYDDAINRALSAYDSGRYAEARTWFRRAHELQPGARTLRTIGMCSFNLGDYADALQNLEAALTESRGRLKDSQRPHVAELVAQCDKKLGRFKVRLSPADATLWVDGRPAQRSASGELLLEPGRHEISAQAPQHRSRQSTLEVDGGDRATLELGLDPLSPSELAAAAAPPPKAGPTRELRAPDTRPTHRQAAAAGRMQSSLGYVALGLAGAGLITFGVTTGLATAAQVDLEDHCPGGACPPAYHDDVDSYDRLKLVSTISLIGTAGFTALGIVLLVTAPDGASRERDVRAQQRHLEPLIGPGSIGLRGRL